MLLEFSVTNFRSIYKRQTLSLVAHTNNDLVETNVHKLEDNKHKVVRSAVIYGANAAGKSNLLRAMFSAQFFIINSTMNLQGEAKIDIAPFAFLESSRNEPTEFEFLISINGVKYNYCFAVTKERVTKEWLVAYPQGKPQRWFEREFDIKTQQYVWHVGINFKGEKKQKDVWQNSTRTNALFLSTAISLNNEQLNPIFQWIQEKLVVLIPYVHVQGALPSINPFISINLLRDPTKKQLLNQFIQIADLGIEELELKEEEQQTNRTNASSIKILAKHKSIDSNKLIPFDLHEESAGTQKLFPLIGGWIKILEEGATIIVDELESSLHPLITRFLISLFHDNIHNTKKAQLVFTTHDSNLLDTQLFRRDQIWFVEKHEGGTILYPLLDFSPRKDEVLERGYLKGKYGAIPFIGEFNF